MKKGIELTPEKFAEIYTDESFRNEVAYAHECWTAHPCSVFDRLETCSHPIRYVVTREQIAEAQKEVERAKAETIENLGNKLVFVGMGMQFEAAEDSDVCNHRIRTELINAHGKHFFVEFGHINKAKIRCDFSIDRVLQNEKEAERNRIFDGMQKAVYGSAEYFKFRELLNGADGQQEYNFGGLEKNQSLPAYTLANILKVVNKTFDSKFTEIVIDNHNLSTDDYKSVSPK
jgi:hypothetical protein